VREWVVSTCFFFPVQKERKRERRSAFLDKEKRRKNGRERVARKRMREKGSGGVSLLFAFFVFFSITLFFSARMRFFSTLLPPPFLVFPSSLPSLTQ